MRNNDVLLGSLTKAVFERLDDPKNKEKGEFPTDIRTILEGIDEEYDEVHKEIFTGRKINKQALRSELADLATFCAFGIALCDKENKNV
jgi:NTP pyrophosphatase (non-canonical NTP hydrolase)